MKRRTLALILALVMTMALVACGGTKTPTTSAGTSSAGTSSPAPAPGSSTTEPSKPAEPEKPAEPKILNDIGALAASACPLNTSSANDTPIRQKTIVSLYGYLPEDGKSALSPMLADGEPVDVNGDGLVWNIKVSKDAKWQNGEAINADTFVYSFRVALDPKTVFLRAAKIAGEFVTIKNANEYLKGECAWDEVGIKKVDDQTIQITLAKPSNTLMVMRHFSTAYTGPVYEPYFTKCLSADGTTTTYRTTQDTIMSCGPFIVTNWVQGSLIEYEKNPNFIRADLVKLDGYTEIAVEDDNTALQMFEKGEIDMVTLNADGVEKYGDDPRVVVTPSRYIYNIEICTDSTKTPLLGNENFRKALYYGIDRQIMAKVTGLRPSNSVVPYPSRAYADGTLYREVAVAEGIVLENYGYDPVKAVEYFEKALKEVGVAKAEINLLLTSDATYEAIGQMLQEQWQNLFGADRFTLSIDSQPSKAASAVRKGSKDDPNAYDITITGWGRATTDFVPLEGVATFISNYSSKNAPYTHQWDAECLALFEEGQDQILDEKKVVANTIAIEKILQEHAIVIPLLYDTNYQMLADRVVTPVDEYDGQIYWGLPYADIAQ